MRRLLALLPLVSLSCASGLQLTLVQSSAEKPSNVAVYFRVSDSKGEPIGGLTAEQFEIYEDGTPVSVNESKQTILNPEVAASHYTLLLVDMSGSVSESDDVANLVEAARVFTEGVSKNNQVGIYAFDGTEELYKISGFTSSAEGAEARVASLSGFSPKDPSTNLNGAVMTALETLDGELEKAKNPLRFGTLVVFTDGTDRAARVTGEEMGDAVEDSPYEVFAIGLGSEISEDELKRVGKSGTAMATDRGSVVEAFDEIAQRVEATTRSYYLLSYCSPARAREHEVRIDAVVTQDDKEKRGSLSYSYDAEGFKPDCDPNRPPKFDVSKGDALNPKTEDGEDGSEKKGR